MTGPVADKDGAAAHDRRRLGGTDRPEPANLSRARPEGHELALTVALGRVARWMVQKRRVDRVAVDGRRHRLAAVRGVLPGAPPGLGVDGEEHTGAIGEKEPPVRDGGRELQEGSRVERPNSAEGRRERHSGCDAKPLGVVPVGGPGDARLLRLWLRDLGRDELVSRRAADVAALRPHVENVGDAGAEDDQYEHRPGDDEPASHASSGTLSSSSGARVPPASVRSTCEKKRVMTTPSRNSPRRGSGLSPFARAIASSG